MKVALAAVALLASAASARADVAFEDFAYGFAIETLQPAGIYTLDLPDAVYTRSLSPDLSDLAVFNAAGETVPHALRAPAPARTQDAAPVALAYFPLNESQVELPEQLTIKLLSDFRGAAIELQQKPPVAADSAVVAYVVDTGQRGRMPAPPIQALLIDWRDGGDSFLTHVDVDTSADLADWRSLRRHAALARLNYAGNRLEENRVDLPPVAERYLRIQWPAGRDGARIDAVRALFVPPGHAPERQWKNIAGHHNDDEAAPAIDYEIAGHLPIAEINVALESVNSLMHGTVYSRDDEKQPWHLRGERIFYRVRIGDTELTNPGIRVGSTTDRFWRVAHEPHAASFGGHSPWLQVGWTPHELVFLARGEGPYRLAYGSARAHLRQAPVSWLLDEVIRAMDTMPMGMARLGSALQAGGAEALLPPLAPLPWRTYLLWSTLVFGVLVLGFLAYRLYRQLHR